MPINLHHKRLMKNLIGFTLIEILVALFIFSILSLMLASGLRTVIQAYQRSEMKAAQMRELRLALLIFSRDVTQAVARPILGASGKEEAAWSGDARSVSLTHTGVVSTYEGRTTLARSKYFFTEEGFWRQTYPVLDQAPQTMGRNRLLLASVIKGQFEYLDQEGQFRSIWWGASNDALPKGIKVTLSLKNGLSLSQFYVIPASTSLAGNEPGSADEKLSPTDTSSS
jgi:general secretion pathway protein J